MKRVVQRGAERGHVEGLASRCPASTDVALTTDRPAVRVHRSATPASAAMAPRESLPNSGR